MSSCYFGLWTTICKTVRPMLLDHCLSCLSVCLRLSTVGSWAFAVAAPDIWNRLPTDVVAANSLSSFRRLLKRFLFRQSYPGVVYWHHPISGPCSGCFQGDRRIGRTPKSLIRFHAWHEKYPKSLKSSSLQRNHRYVKKQNHKHYKVKSQTQMRKYRKCAHCTKSL